MTLDLDALEALAAKVRMQSCCGRTVECQGNCTGGMTLIQRLNSADTFGHALPELIRLARIGQRVERDAKETKCST